MNRRDNPRSRNFPQYSEEPHGYYEDNYQYSNYNGASRNNSGRTFQNFKRNNNYRPQERPPPRQQGQSYKKERPPPRSGNNNINEEKPKARPAPMHLSKTTSELKNDPAHREAFMPASAEELVPVAEEFYHYPGCDGVSDLIDESYEMLGAQSKKF